MVYIWYESFTPHLVLWWMEDRWEGMGEWMDREVDREAGRGGWTDGWLNRWIIQYMFICLHPLSLIFKTVLAIKLLFVFSWFIMILRVKHYLFLYIYIFWHFYSKGFNQWRSGTEILLYGSFWLLQNFKDIGLNS